MSAKPVRKLGTSLLQQIQSLHTRSSNGGGMVLIRQIYKPQCYLEYIWSLSIDIYVKKHIFSEHQLLKYKNVVFCHCCSTCCVLPEASSCLVPARMPQFSLKTTYLQWIFSKKNTSLAKTQQNLLQSNVQLCEQPLRKQFGVQFLIFPGVSVVQSVTKDILVNNENKCVIPAQPLQYLSNENTLLNTYLSFI